MAKLDFKFSWTFRVRYAEVDGQMIVFNAHYLTYYDTAITEYFRALPYDYMGQVKRTGEDYHTVRTLVEYKQPIAFDEDIEVLHMNKDELDNHLASGNEALDGKSITAWYRTKQFLGL